jgi:hypothetical protein
MLSHQQRTGFKNLSSRSTFGPPDGGSKAGQHDHQNYQAYDQDCREIAFREFHKPLDNFKQDVDKDEPDQSDDDQPAHQL